MTILTGKQKPSVLIETIRRGLTKAALALTLFCPQISQAGTTTADFLEWERSAQDSFIQVSISMLMTVATQVKPEMADCIGIWYFDQPSEQLSLHSGMIETMADYKEFSPTTFVLGYAESVCGKLNE